jgi:hypothetical protein
MPRRSNPPHIDPDAAFWFVQQPPYPIGKIALHPEDFA